VLKLKDVFMTSDHLNIVQELVQGGTLLDCVNYCLRRGRPMRGGQCPVGEMYNTARCYQHAGTVASW
jgi:hypothetical protein